MKCSKIERLILMSGDGALSQKDEAAVDRHIASCPHCREIASQLVSIQRELKNTPDFTMIPQHESDGIVRETCTKLLHPSNKRRPSWAGIPAMPRIAFAGLAGACLLFGAFVVPLIYRASTRSHAVPSTACVRPFPPETAIVKDSTFTIDRYCTVRLKSPGSFTLIRGDESVVHLLLHSGSVFISAKKGFYDTIAVQTGGKEVFATGTHFMVERGKNDITVEVLEGTVKVRTRDYDYPVEEHEKLTIADKENRPSLLGLLSDEQIALSKEFDGMTDAQTNPPSFNNGVRPAMSRAGVANPGAFTRAVTADRDSAAFFEFLAAKKFVSRGEFLSASRIFEHYLKSNRRNADSAWFELGYCYTILHRYEDALSAYHKVAAPGVDGSLVETSIHRINKLLYLRFKKFDEAGESIAGYLSRYPRGKWRDEEMYLYIQIKLYNNDSAAVDSLTQLYANEFPHNCRVKELSGRAKSRQR
jgi:TolA-binding protein